MMPLANAAQVVEKRMETDKLSLAERLSIRTNMLDWTLLMPNIGVEFDVKSTNWNRWAVGLSVRGNWQTGHTFKRSLVYNLMGVRAEFRNYWRPRQIGAEGVVPHTNFIDKVFSCRRTHVKHPGLIFYRGLYVSYNDFSIKLTGDGYQGSALTAGFTYGVVKPLYAFKNGNSLDFELGVSAGASMARYDRFRHDRESDCYPVTEQKGWSIVSHPVVSDLRVGFVYRFGKYPSTRKYRWRYDCDPVYKHRIDSIRTEEERERINRETLDSIIGEIRKDFWHDYDSIASANKAAADSVSRMKVAAKAAVEKQRRADRERERRAGLDAKAAAKAAKAKAMESPVPTDSTATAPPDTAEPVDSSVGDSEAGAEGLSDSPVEESPSTEPPAEETEEVTASSEAPAAPADDSSEATTESSAEALEQTVTDEQQGEGKEAADE